MQLAAAEEYELRMGSPMAERVREQSPPTASDHTVGFAVTVQSH